MFRIKYLAIALAVSSSSAMAAADFQGFYGQFGVGYENIFPEKSLSGNVNGNLARATVYSNSSNNLTGKFGIGYAAKVTDGFFLGIGGDYSPIESGEMASFSVVKWTQGGVLKSARFSKKIKQENSYSFFVSPALTLGDSGLVYGKVGFAGAKFSEDGHKSTMDGVLLGLGVKRFMSEGFYWFIEGNYVKYNDKYKSLSLTETKVSSTNIYTGEGTYGGRSYNLMAGIGYRF